MRELLKELAKIDPDCYAEIERGLEQVDIEYEDDIIQGACQRAIVARKWGYSQIAKINDDHVCEIWWPGACGMDSAKLPGNTPAEAILAAYIAARKAQP